jgi:hypothetical protein
MFYIRWCNIIFSVPDETVKRDFGILIAMKDREKKLFND